jgi:8-oxo-dGTP pyrophosphatase MutT (NUDIX family)
MYFNVAAAVAALIFDSEGRLLFTIRKHEPAKGLLDLPGGFVDNDESAEEALVREVKEELNLDIIESRYITSLPNLYLYEGITYRTLDFIFECKVKNLGNIEPNDDVDGYRFIHPNTEMADQVGLLSIRKLMDLYLQRPD